MIAGTFAPPSLTQSIAARLCWLNTEPFEPQRRYLLRHTTRTVKARIRNIDARVNIHTLERDPFVGQPRHERHRARAAGPAAADRLRSLRNANRATGAFILIDEVTNQTVAAGLID